MYLELIQPQETNSCAIKKNPLLSVSVICGYLKKVYMCVMQILISLNNKNPEPNIGVNAER